MSASLANADPVAGIPLWPLSSPSQIALSTLPGAREMTVPMDSERALLKHYLAAIAYRTQEALRDAPAEYPDFAAGHRARTPVEILRHMTSVLGYARTLFLGGSYPFNPEPLATFRDEVERFHGMVAALGALLDEGVALKEISYEQQLDVARNRVPELRGQISSILKT